MTEDTKQEIYDQIMNGSFDRDIVVLEDIHIVPYLNEEYHSQYFYIGMCKNGFTKGQYDYRDVVFRAGDICWILPEHVLSHSYVSEDYSLLSVFITRPFFLHLKQAGVLGKFQYLAHLSCIHLSPEIFDVMYNGFRLLGSMDAIDNPKRRNLIVSLISIISAVCDHYILTEISANKRNLKLHEELFERFCDAIIEHYRESREVSFYANLLCRSPKYFATVIKQTTGLAASEWINRYVVIEAKWLLLHERRRVSSRLPTTLAFRSRHRSVAFLSISKA